MFSAFRQFAERTVSSRSSTGRSRIGSTCGDIRSAAGVPVPCRSANTDSCSTSTEAA